MAATGTFEMIRKSFEDEVMRSSKTFERHQRLIWDCEPINSRAGRP